MLKLVGVIFNYEIGLRKKELENKFKHLHEDLIQLDKDENYNFETVYYHCTASVQKLTLKGALSQSDLLEFYGLYKQAVSGNAEDKNAPSVFDYKGKTKYEAWKGTFNCIIPT